MVVINQATWVKSDGRILPSPDAMKKDCHIP